MDERALAAALERSLGAGVHSLKLTAGGDINDAFRAETELGSVFVKTSPAAQPGVFTDEAAGLQWLDVEGGVRVPRVLGVHDDAGVDVGGATTVGAVRADDRVRDLAADLRNVEREVRTAADHRQPLDDRLRDPEADVGNVEGEVRTAADNRQPLDDRLRVTDVGGQLPRLLALEWIDQGVLSRAGEEEIGRGLAAVHRAGAPSFGATPVLGGGSAHAPMRFNELTLPNEPRATWAEFYAENRLLALAEEAHRRGFFAADDVALVERLAERLPELAGPEEPPARTHGDLWAGNVLADDTGRPWLIDPVAHGGHREVDLALLSVFGGPSPRCFAAYDEAFPRAAGFAERTELWQLAMILLHVCLFGGSYITQARQITTRHL